MKKVSVGDNLHQEDKVLSSAGINWQAFFYLFSLNVVSIFLLTMKLLKQNRYHRNFVFIRSS